MALHYTGELGFLMVTTSMPPSKSTNYMGERAGPFEDNKLITVVSLELFDPYSEGEASYGRCRWKKVFATTDEGVRFLLHDDNERIHNARQYGSGGDPVWWGKDLPGYANK